MVRGGSSVRTCRGGCHAKKRLPFFTLGLALALFATAVPRTTPSPKPKQPGWNRGPRAVPAQNSPCCLLRCSARSRRAGRTAADILDIRKIPGEEGDVYEIIFREGKINPPIYIAEDGTLLTGKPGTIVGAPGQLSGTDLQKQPAGSRPGHTAALRRDRHRDGRAAKSRSPSMRFQSRTRYKKQKLLITSKMARSSRSRPSHENAFQTCRRFAVVAASAKLT